MNRILRALSRLFLLACLGSLAPLRAQLNPQLITATPDFLDLYQASATAISKNKPEVCTVFDFSGSMQSLMNHYQYQNGDTQDGDDYCPMKFVLGSSGGSVTIKAASTWDASCSSSITFTMGSGSFGSSSASSHTKTGNNGGSWSIQTKITAVTYPGGTTTSSTPIAFSATVTEGTTSNPSRSPVPWSNAITWTATAGTIDASGNWTAPPSPVTVTLTGGSFWNTSASPNSMPTLTSNSLITPSGAVVTSTMVTSSTTYDEGTAAASDVRNWIRCASHVRFQYTDPSNSVVRTIDIPIPWEITDASSTGCPLSSLKVNDPSTGDQEIDGIHLLNSGNWVFCTGIDGNGLYPTGYPAASTVQTTVYMGFVRYRPSYIYWLFTGKYGGNASSPYYGKYVVFDANPTLSASAAGYGQAYASWGQGYGQGGSALVGNSITVPSFDSNFNYVADVAIDASQNVVPARSRCEAVKEAAIRTWIAYQSQVIWAYRFLDPTHEAGVDVAINNNSTTNAPTYLPTNTSNTSPVSGTYSSWTIMNGNSAAAMQNLAAYIPYNGTPLTAAMARAYAQFSDASSVFNAVEIGGTGNLPLPQQCQNHVLMLFTDGLDNNGGSGTNPSATPYLTTSGSTTSFSAVTGNQAIIANTSVIDGTYWNLFTMAAAAAHLGDTNLATGSYMTVPTYPNHTSADVTSFLPFAIPSRGDTTHSNKTPFTPPARIQTYTIGVSLGGTFSNAASPKASLFYAALMGDPTVNSYSNISGLTPFVLKNPLDSSSGPAANSIYYFDGTNPTALVNSLNYAIASTLKNGPNSASNPNIPFVGASLGSELYVGEFTPPSSTSPLWPGDLLMFATQVVNGAPVIVNGAGTQVTALTAANAQWSAVNSMPLWSSRHLWTRIPETGTTDPGLASFTDQTAGLAVISPYINNGNGEPLSSNTKAQAVQNAAGANLTGSLDVNGRPTSNRATIMGDIIDSSPAALEYNLTQIKANSAFASYPHISAFANPQHFRIIIVGDNQGWVHGFGEVSATNSIGNDTNGNPINITTGAVDELWAFMPTDFLPYLDYLETQNTHQFMSDGSPTIYFLDLPSTGYPNGNGVFDTGNNERAIAIFGLRKGGRSYYALNIANPFVPTLQWALRPDESATLATKTLVDGTPAINAHVPSGTNVTSIVANMGWSTCIPALGRVQYNGYLRDAVFLGGGFSVKQLDHNFPTYPAPTNQSTAMGRSILALDAYTGQILAAADMTKVKATIGPIGSALVPFEFFLGSGMAQRAYFNDYLGGLWCWDQNVVSTTAPYTGYRMDSSDLGTWSGDQSVKVRQVYQDSSTATPLYTNLPAPFTIGTFPGNPSSSTLASPAAVGILMASGDRNNPIDETSGYGVENGGPTTVPTTTQPFRLTCVFDRQDTSTWSSLLTLTGTSYVITDSNLVNFSGSNTGLPSLTMGNTQVTKTGVNPSNYYLAPTNADGSPATASTKFGYYINFPTGTLNASSNSGIFVPKALSDPIVVAGAAFYSYFTPTTAQTCGGGNGNTVSDILCDVINPALSVASASCQTGSALPSGISSWTGVPSNFTNFGTTGVLQGGVVTNGTTTTVQLEMLKNAATNKYPKIRVWRVIH